jgi:hypothetical protein
VDGTAICGSGLDHLFWYIVILVWKELALDNARDAGEFFALQVIGVGFLVEYHA